MARPRKKAKPPPNIITAGGVDMARGHASGIQVREGGSREPSSDEPRVVIAVETDLRKVPTHRRLAAGRDPAEDGARAAALPGRRHAGRAADVHPTPVSTAAARVPGSQGAPSGEAPRPRSATPPPAPPADARKLPVGMRLAFAAVLLLLLVGVAQRSRAPSAPEPQAVDPGIPAAAEIPPPPQVVPPAPILPLEATPPAAPPPSAAPVELAETPRRAATAHAHRPARTPPPPHPPRAAFTPPFQLPSEKN